MAQPYYRTRRNPQGGLEAESSEEPGMWRHVPPEHERSILTQPEAPTPPISETPSPQPPKAEAEGIGAHWQRGLASGVTLGIDPAEEALSSGFRRFGVDVATGEPQTAWESGARTAGELVGSIPPIAALAAGGWVPASLGGAAALARTYPLATQTLRQMITNPYTRRPATTALSEGAAGFGAGSAEKLAEGTGYEPVAGTLGAILGGGGSAVVGSGPMVGMARRLGKSLTRRGREQMKADMGQGRQAVEKVWKEHDLSPGKSALSPSGGFEGGTITGQRVTESVRGRVADRDKALAALKKKAISRYTTIAQKIGDPNILANAEFIIQSQGPEALAAYHRQADKAVQDLGRKALRVGSRPSQTRPEVPDVVAGLREELEKKAVSLGRDVPRTNVAVRASRDLLGAYTGAKATEDKLWKAVKAENRDVRIKTGDIVKAWKTLIKDTKEAQKDDIPKKVKSLLSFLEKNPEVPPDEIQAIYSTFRDIARADLGSNESRLANEFARMADASLEPFGAYQEARAHTRTMHDAFDRNADIWKLFQGAGRATEMDIRRNPTAIMEKLGLFKGSSTSANAMRDLLDASAFSGPVGQRNNAQTVEALGDFLKKELLLAARREDGRELASASGARDFIAKHADLWDGERFPELVSVGNQLSSIARQVERADRLAGLRKEVGAVLTAERPLMLFRSKLQLGPEGGGQLSRIRDRSLVQSSLLDEATRIAPGEEGAGTFRRDAGERLSRYLEAPETREVFEAVYTKPELRRLKAIADEWNKVSMAFKKPEAKGAIISGGDILEDSLLGRMVGWVRTAGRVGAAQAPHRLGFGGGGMGGGIQTASIAASRADKALKGQMDAAVWETLERAYQDEELLRSIFQNADTLSDSSLRRLLSIGGGVLGNLLGPTVKRVGTSTAVPLAKTATLQAPTEEELREAVRWFQENRASFAPLLQVPPLEGPPE
jgi:hypothetical protein